jgi:hypothetical protein
MFNEPVGPSQSSIQQANEYAAKGVDLGMGSSSNASSSVASSIPFSPADAATVGAGTGLILGGKSAMAPAPKNTQLIKAQADAAASQQSAQSMKQLVQTKAQEHAQRVEDTQKALDNARVKHAETTAQHMAARDEATKLNALPADERPLTKMEQEMLDKAVADAKTAGIAIDEGAMAHSIKMGNIHNYNEVRKGIAGTKESLPAAEKTAVSGMKQLGHLIVPDTVADASLLNSQQLEAQKKYLETKNAMKSTATDVAKHQGILESLNKKGAIPQQLESKANDKILKANETSTKAKILDEALSESGLSKFGRVAGKVIGPVLGGAGAGFEGAQALEDYQKGEYLPMALHAMGALGSGLAMIPHPLAKGVGTVIAAPGIAYDIYDAMRPGALPSKDK